MTSQVYEMENKLGTTIEYLALHFILTSPATVSVST